MKISFQHGVACTQKQRSEHPSNKFGLITIHVISSIGVASYGALGHVPPLDFQLVILGITRFTDSDENVQKQRDFAQFLSILADFCHFLPTVFLRE